MEKEGRKQESSKPGVCTAHTRERERQREEKDPGLDNESKLLACGRILLCGFFPSSFSLTFYKNYLPQLFSPLSSSCPVERRTLFFLCSLSLGTTLF